jgi:phage-related protein
VPLDDWIVSLPPKARAKCFVRIERLAMLGHELRRPEADTLRDGIHELRVKHAGINYRILYFFHGKNVIVLTHGFVKQRADVPRSEIAIAASRRSLFQAAPDLHTSRWIVDE